MTPYHVEVPTFGDWGFALARRGDTPPRPTVPSDAPPLRFLNQAALDDAKFGEWCTTMPVGGTLLACPPLARATR